jgi:hypothetical protein
MGAMISNSVTTRPVGVSVLRLPSERMLGWIGLAAIVARAALLRFANLSELGYPNQYYTAAVKAMLQSWHNFARVERAQPAADPLEVSEAIN